jgi:hypothetical protein
MYKWLCDFKDVRSVSLWGVVAVFLFKCNVFGGKEDNWLFWAGWAGWVATCIAMVLLRVKRNDTTFITLISLCDRFIVWKKVNKP